MGGGGGGDDEKKNNKKALKMTSLLTGHFQRGLFYFFFFIFRAFFPFFNISRKNSKTSEVNQQSVLILYRFHHFPKNLDRTITFNSVTLKNTKKEPQKYINFFQLNKWYSE